MNSDIVSAKNLPESIKKQVKFVYNKGLFVYEYDTKETITLSEFEIKYKVQIRDINIDFLLNE